MWVVFLRVKISTVFRIHVNIVRMYSWSRGKEVEGSKKRKGPTYEGNIKNF